MAMVSEGNYTAEFLLSEANGSRSRESITVLSGENLAAGAVLGAVNTGTATATAFASNTGDGAMGAITVSGAAKAGVYRLTVVSAESNAGAFQVEDPDGVMIGTGNVAAAFNAGGLAFTLADGSTDFAAGDGFNITVDVSATKYKAYNPSNTDGSQVPVAVLYSGVDASSADAEGVAIVRDAEVAAVKLAWFTSATEGQIAAGIAGLAARGIFARS